MKLCWDNIENIRLSKKGNFRDEIHKITYNLNICIVCGEEFLCRNNQKSCSKQCANKGKNNPMYGKPPHNKGKHLSDKHKENLRKSHLGKKLSNEHKEKISISHRGEKSYLWKGGYYSKGIPIYDTYAPQLEWAEEVRRYKDDPNILEVRCFKCKEWYIPKVNNIDVRIQCLKNNVNYRGQNYLYCSKQCKNTCSIYGKSPESIMKEDAIRAGRLPWLELIREVQPELRDMVLERDSHQCTKCGNKDNIQCHHIYPVNIEPLLSADMDNCMTLCYPCHYKVHQQDGCRYGQLGMEEC